MNRKQRHSQQNRRRKHIERKRAKRAHKHKGRTRSKSAPPTPLTRRVLAAHDDRIRAETEAKQRTSRRAKIDKNRATRKTIAGNK